MPDLSEVFAVAVEMERAREQEAYLDRVCADRPELRKRVDQLLAADSRAGEPRQEAEETRVLDGLMPGAQMDRYRLVRKLGQGGYGSVFLAEQQQPVRRQVALKVVKMGMDTEQVVARFEAERQALALMDHPGIAQVYDAGATDSGRPYFVMEFVPGKRITHYCDERKLPMRERLQLFIKVCAAVQHAHQKGVIHRDLKPSNLLVTEVDGEPVAKVIDFGIAKAMDDPLTEHTLLTLQDHFVGTPAYVSPEQAVGRSSEIDTRSDIYSLGVVLYELLAGRPPFDGEQLLASGIEAMRRTLSEMDPPRPSTRLQQTAKEEVTSMAKARLIEPGQLIQALRGDLDWVVMKCLEKRPERRYGSAGALGQDLQRHLDHEAVTARPPSWGYLTQKAFRRHRLAFSMGAAVVGTLILGLGLASWQALEKNRAFQLARAAEQEQLRLRREAERRVYAGDMNQAKRALDLGNLGWARELLDRHRPTDGKPDLRGWEWRYLWKQTKSDAEKKILKKSSAVSSLSVNCDGRFLAVGEMHRGELTVWDLREDRPWAQLATGSERVKVAFSPTDPALLAFTTVRIRDSGEWESALSLWNAETREELRSQPLDAVCVGLAFSSDGRRLVTSTSGPRQGKMVLREALTLRPLISHETSQFGLYEPTMEGFAATADLKVAAYSLSREENAFCVIDLESGKELWRQSPLSDLAVCLTFSRDGKTLASSSGFGDQRVRLWDVATGTQKLSTLEDHVAWVGGMVFSKDGRRLFTGSGDQTIRAWDLATGESTDILVGHRLEVFRLVWLPNMETLVSGSKDGEVLMWDASAKHSRQSNFRIPVSVVSFGFSQDGQSVITLDDEGNVDRWSGAPFGVSERLLEGADPQVGKGFRRSVSDDGRLIALASSDGTIDLWNLETRQLERRLPAPEGGVAELAFFGRGQRLMVTAETGEGSTFWDVSTGLLLGSYLPASPRVRLAYGLGPDEVVGIDFNRRVNFFHLLSREKAVRELDYRECDRGVFSPDRRWFAVASQIGYARVWETTSWSEVATLGGFKLGLDAVTFSPDVQRLVVGGGSDRWEAVRLYDVQSWRDVITLEKDGSHNVEAKFSADQRWLAVMDTDGALVLWEAPSWEEIAAMERDVLQ